MKKLLLSLLLPTLLLGQQSDPTFVNTVANDGQNAITYKSFKINDYASNNNQSEYNAHPTNSADFDAMFDYANKNTTTWTHQGRDTATKAFTWPWSNILPRHDNSNFGWIIEGYFVPPTSGTYSFQLNSDDRSDFWFDANDDGTITNTGIGMGNGTRTVDIANLTADVSYKFRVRYEQGAGGANLYLKWKSPEDTAAGAAYAFNGNTIWSIDADDYVEPITYNVTYNFHSNITPSNFGINTYYQSGTNEVTQNSNSSTITPNSNGSVDISNQIDETLVGNGKYDITATPGSVEWVVIYAPMVTNKYRYRIGLDVREFPNGVGLSDINNVELLDLVDTDGTSTFDGSTYDNYWLSTTSDQYWNHINYYTWNAIPFSSSNYSSNIRAMSYGNYALKVDLNFTETQGYKTQYAVFNEPSSTYLTSLAQSVITVADVYLAFQELTDRGINNNQSGNKFTHGIQYANANLDRDSDFDFDDTYLMLDWLNGGTAFNTSGLSSIMRLIETTEYNSVASSAVGNYTTQTMYPLSLATGTNSYTKNITVSWLGDVNMSHSPTPTNNLTITGAPPPLYMTSEPILIELYSETELKDGKVHVLVKTNNRGAGIGAIQLNLLYNSSILTLDSHNFNSDATDFINDQGGKISFGSLKTGEGAINNQSTYEFIFDTTDTTGSLGLVLIKPVEALTTNNEQVFIELQ